MVFASTGSQSTTFATWIGRFAGWNMAKRFGPSRGELIFRSVVSVFGLAFLGLAIFLRGVPEGPGLVEVLGVGLALFGGTLVLSPWKLIRRDHP